MAASRGKVRGDRGNAQSDLGAQERVFPGTASPQPPVPGATEPAAGLDGLAGGAGSDSPLDLDVTVLAFAQWVSEMKSRQQNSQNQLRAEMSMIRNAITANQTDLTDFKRHGAAIQQQMQSEINEIRESLSGVFMEITAAVRNNSAADQDLKLKIQSLNEQAVRNETCFAQLAEAADQSQSKLRSAVTEMQLSSERMRDELGTLSRHSEHLEATVSERGERVHADMELLSQDVATQLDRRREHFRKMLNDVVGIGESLQTLVADLEDQRKGATENQGRIQSSVYAVDHTLRQEVPSVGAAGCGGACRGSLAATVDVVPAPPANHAAAAAAHPRFAAPMAGPPTVVAAGGSPVAPRAPGPAGGAGLAGMGHSPQHAAAQAAYAQGRPMQMGPMVYR